MVRSAKHLVICQLFVRNSLLEKAYFIVSQRFVKLFSSSKNRSILLVWIHINNRHYDLMADLALKLLYLSILNYILIFNKEWKCSTYNMLFYALLYIIINLFSCNNMSFRKNEILINVKIIIKISFPLGTLKAVYYLCEVLKKIPTKIVPFCNTLRINSLSLKQFIYYIN